MPVAGARREDVAQRLQRDGRAPLAIERLVDRAHAALAEDPQHLEAAVLTERVRQLLGVHARTAVAQTEPSSSRRIPSSSSASGDAWIDREVGLNVGSSRKSPSISVIIL